MSTFCNHGSPPDRRRKSRRTASRSLRKTSPTGRQRSTTGRPRSPVRSRRRKAQTLAASVCALRRRERTGLLGLPVVLLWRPVGLVFLSERLAVLRLFRRRSGGEPWLQNVLIAGRLP